LLVLNSIFFIWVVWLKYISKALARLCNLFFFFKAISFFWADYLFLIGNVLIGNVPAAGRSAVTSAANSYVAADECRLRKLHLHHQGFSERIKQPHRLHLEKTTHLYVLIT